MTRSVHGPSSGKAVLSPRGQEARMPPLFVTGTDTDVGKTILTGLILQLAEANHYPIVAAKPFCTGNRNDVDTLRRLQKKSFRRSTINPFFFQPPVAPLVAARQCGHFVPLSAVCGWARRLRRRAPNVVFEGCGGLLTPWGEGYDATDFMRALGCRACLVAPNRLGVLNHVLLAVDHLKQRLIPCAAVVCMAASSPDSSAASNATVLAELIAPTPVVSVPFLGASPLATRVLEGKFRKLKKTLARLLLFDTFCAPFEGEGHPVGKKVLNAS